MMGYRTLEISTSCEIHIKEGQLEVTSDSGSILIPIEDLSQIMFHGANIRLSTMDLSILSRNKVSLMTLDEVKPKTGVVRLLRLTEKQYNNIYMVTGEPDYQEKTVGVNCHIMI